MTCHENVTRESRDVSQGLSHCPDPTRPDPTHSIVTVVSSLGDKAHSFVAAVDARGRMNESNR